MGRQSDALRATIGALTLRADHAALVAYCEGLAAVLDEFPERATLWREYRPALELLLAVGEADVDDAQAALLELVRTPMGNKAKPKKANDGTAGRSGGGKSGAAVDAVAGAGSERRRRATP